MKNYNLLLITALLSLPQVLLAQGNHGPAGCGLGSKVIFKQADEWHEHALAALTNASASNTFAMTSGTLGCEDANGPLSAVLHYIDTNLEQLALESAKGQGETISGLGELLGIQPTDKPRFQSTLKQNFDTIFNNANANSREVLNAISEIMEQDDTLAKYFA